MQIIHIHHKHKLPFGVEPKPEIFEATVKSQFLVAQEIKKYPGIPIVLEALYEDAQDSSSLAFTQIAKNLFPNGLPTDFEKLTATQKAFLYEKGGVRTLFYLGEIPTIYKSIHKEISDQLDKKIAAANIYDVFRGDLSELYEPREIEAVACSKEAAIKHFGKTEGASVILVFGSGHNFQPYCEKEGFEYVLIKQDLSTTEDLSNKQAFKLDTKDEKNIRADSSKILFKHHPHNQKEMPIKKETKLLVSSDNKSENRLIYGDLKIDFTETKDGFYWKLIVLNEKNRDQYKIRFWHTGPINKKSISDIKTYLQNNDLASLATLLETKGEDGIKISQYLQNAMKNKDNKSEPITSPIVTKPFIASPIHTSEAKLYTSPSNLSIDLNVKYRHLKIDFKNKDNLYWEFIVLNEKNKDQYKMFVLNPESIREIKQHLQNNDLASLAKFLETKGEDGIKISQYLQNAMKSKDNKSKPITSPFVTNPFIASPIHTNKAKLYTSPGNLSIDVNAKYGHLKIDFKDTGVLYWKLIILNEKKGEQHTMLVLNTESIREIKKYLQNNDILSLAKFLESDEDGIKISQYLQSEITHFDSKKANIKK